MPDPRIEAGTCGTVNTPLTSTATLGGLSPGTFWSLSFVNSLGQITTLATSSTPNGWSVVRSGTTATVCVPVGFNWEATTPQGPPEIAHVDVFWREIDNPVGFTHRVRIWEGEISTLLDDGEEPPPDPDDPDDEAFDGDGTAWVSLAISDAQRHARAYVVTEDEDDTEGRIWIDTAKEATPATWQPVDTGIDGAFPRIYWLPGDTANRLALLYVHSGDVLYRLTSDEGSTWSTPVAIGSGSHPDAVMAKDGLKYLYWKSGTALKSQWLNGDDTLARATFTTSLSTGVNYFAISEFVQTGGAWKLTIFVRSGTTLKIYTSPDGINFTEVV